MACWRTGPERKRLRRTVIPTASCTDAGSRGSWGLLGHSQGRPGLLSCVSHRAQETWGLSSLILRAACQPPESALPIPEDAVGRCNRPAGCGPVPPIAAPHLKFALAKSFHQRCCASDWANPSVGLKRGLPTATVRAVGLFVAQTWDAELVCGRQAGRGQRREEK